MLDAYAEGLRDRCATAASTSSTRRTACRPTPRSTLRDEGVIDHVIRTVHHVDDFTSPSLIECQDRSIAEPDHVLCVSQPWVERLRDEFGVEAGLVANGVDAARFRPPRDDGERAAARERARASATRFAVLTVGGIEPRKGSLTLLARFAAARRALARTPTRCC